MFHEFRGCHDQNYILHQMQHGNNWETKFREINILKHDLNLIIEILLTCIFHSIVSNHLPVHSSSRKYSTSRKFFLKWMRLENIKSKNDWNVKKVTQSKQIHAQNMFKVNKKTPERRHWPRSNVFFDNFEHISHVILVSLLLTLSR